MTTMLMLNRSMNQSPNTTSTSSTRFQPIVSNLYPTFTSQLIDDLPVKQRLTMNESLKVSHNEDSQLTIDVMDLSSGNVVDHNNNEQDGQMDIDKCPTDSDSCDSPLAQQPTSQQSPNKLNFGMESILNREEVGSVGSDKHSDNCSSPAMLVGSYCANNTATTTAAASIQNRPKRLSPSISSSSASFSSSISPTSSSNLQHTPNGVPLFRCSAAPQESASLEHLPTSLMTSGITSESNSIPNGDNSILFHPKPTRASLSIPASRPAFFNQHPSHFPTLHHQAPETFYQTNNGNSFATPNSATDSSVFGSWPHFPFFESNKMNESAFTSNNNNNKSPVSTVPISQSTLATIPFHSLFPNIEGFYDSPGYYPQPQMANGKMTDSHSATQPASSNSLLGNFHSNSTLAAAAAAYSNILPYSTLMSYLNCANLSYYNSYINNQSSSSQPTGSTKTNPALNGTNPTVSNHHNNAKAQNSRPFPESRSISHNNTNNNNTNNSSNLNREKKKRSWSRAVFSTLQRKGLEKRFSIQRYITKPDRRLLAATLGLTDAQVKVWFQNRRMKWRLSLEYRNEIPLIGAMHQQELNSLIHKSTMVKCPTVASATAADATNKNGRQSTMTPGSNGSTSTGNHQHHNNNNNKPSLQKANPAAVTTTNGTSK